MRTGGKHSKATKQKMSASHSRRLAHRKKGTCRMCGSAKHSYTQHQKRLVKARAKSKVWKRAVVIGNRLHKTGKKASAGTKAKMSRTQLVVQNLPAMKAVRSEQSKKMWANRSKAEKAAIVEKISAAQVGRMPGSYYFSALYSGKCGDIRMRSTWEVAMAEKLDLWHMRWQYEPRMFYVGKGRWRGQNYTPDFYLPKYRLYIEVKGYLNPENTRKMCAFRCKYPNIKWIMLQKDDLEMIGVFDKSQDSGALFARKVLA